MARHSRRSFLKHSALSLGAAAQFGGLPGFVQAAPGEDYRALVCVLLAGGADSFNMLLPYDQPRYDAYGQMRADLALDRTKVLPLSYNGPDGRAFAVHPGFGETNTYR